MTQQPFNQALHPKDAAGRFTETSRAEPQVLDLWDPQDGTYEFPPFPDTVGDLVHFWQTVKIPDEVLLSTVNAYRTRQDLEVTQERSRAYYAYWKARRVISPDMDPKYRAKFLEEEWPQHYQSWLESRRDTAPEFIPDPWVRSVVRAAKMWDYLPALATDEDRELVKNLQVRLPGGGGGSVEWLVTRFRLEQLIPDMVDKSLHRTFDGIAAKEYDDRVKDYLLGTKTID